MSKKVEQFYAIIPRTDIHKVKRVEPEPAVRLYCATADTTWNLQVRGQLKLADGSRGKDFIVATAPLNREQLLALRASIDEHLAEYADCRDLDSEAES